MGLLSWLFGSPKTAIVAAQAVQPESGGMLVVKGWWLPDLEVKLPYKVQTNAGRYVQVITHLVVDIHYTVAGSGFSVSKVVLGDTVASRDGEAFQVDGRTRQYLEAAIMQQMPSILTTDQRLKKNMWGRALGAGQAPTEPATEKQKAFARKLRIPFPDDISKQALSMMISAKTGR